MKSDPPRQAGAPPSLIALRRFTSLDKTPPVPLIAPDALDGRIILADGWAKTVFRQPTVIAHQFRR